MKYKSITIENFRGISHLELSDLKDFNLIVGRNNCGKTSVLEAMYLLSGMANPQLIISINGFRDIFLADKDDFSSMFKNLDSNSKVQLEGRIDSESSNRSLTITRSFGVYSHSVKAPSEQNVYLRSSDLAKTPPVDGINFDFIHKNRKFHCEYSLKDGKIHLPENYKEDLAYAYLNPININNVNKDEEIDNLIINKKLSSVISVLKSFDSSIKDISIGRKTVYVDIGAEQMIPINAFGDGMQRILTLLVSIAAIKNGVLMVDEIENGMHYSSLSILWKAVFDACVENNVQIIATTHSYECVENFSKTYETFNSKGDDIRLFRLGKEGEKHKAYSYSAEVLKAGIEKEFEVR